MVFSSVADFYKQNLFSIFITQLLFYFLKDLYTLMHINEDKIVRIDHLDENSFPQKIAEFIGTTVDHGRVYAKSEYGEIDYRFFNTLENLKVIVHDCVIEQEVGVRHVNQNEEELVYIIIQKEGNLTHYYESENNIEILGPERQRGIVISNLRNPVINYGIEGTHSKWVTMIIKKGLVKNYFEDRFPQVQELLTSTKPWILFENHTYEIATALDQIFDANKDRVSYKSIIYSQAIYILGQIFEFFEERDLEDVRSLDSFDTERLFEIRQYISKDLSKPPVLEEICDEFGISRSKLIRDFKAEFGKPVYQFYSQLRMDEARNMLLHQKKSVTEVSQELGFKGISKFSDAFKKHYGMSPKVMIELKK